MQGTDEVGTLLGALVAMKRSLTDIIERVQSAADQRTYKIGGQT